jgi:hypothetical protein
LVAAAVTIHSHEELLVFAALVRFLSLLIVIVSFTAPAWADSWVKPTQEELRMTAEPEAPGAAAIFLLRDERTDDKIHMYSTYVRLKILSEREAIR